MNTSSKTFCPVPWTTLNIDQRGIVMPCMHSIMELGNIKEKPIQEIINGSVHRGLKNSMANGEWHSGCVNCRVFEESTGASPRTVRILSQDTKDSIDQDIDFFKLEHLTINWSNLCNLTCTYCNDETSTSWQSLKKIPIDFVRNNHQSLIELVADQGKNIRGLTLGGGEPLLQKGLEEFLQHLDPGQVSVLVTTNLSVDVTTNPVYQILKAWPSVNWQVSFDNVSKDKFEYVRRGASWELFVRNIQQLKLDKQEVWAHPAYSIYCALELDSYYAFCTKHDLKIFWCDLSDPWDLDVRRYPKNIRELAIAQIDRVTDMYTHPVTDSLTLSTLARYRKQLVDNNYFFNPEYVPNCVRYHEQLEKLMPGTCKFLDLWSEFDV